MLMLGLLAACYVQQDRNDEAWALCKEVLALEEPTMSAHSRSHALHYITYVANKCWKHAEAIEVASRNVEIAERHGLYERAARAHSGLIDAIYSESGDAARSIELASKVAENSLRAGNRPMYQWALLNLYLLQTESADFSEMHRIESALSVADFGHIEGTVLETLLEADALRSVWAGDFERAYKSFATNAERRETPEMQAMTSAKAALYAAGAGFKDRALAMIAIAERALTGLSRRRFRSDHALIYLALTWLVLGEPNFAANALSQLRADPGVTNAVFRDAARALQECWYVRGPHADVEIALEGLWSRRLGGLALMIEALRPPDTEKRS
jgi:hypothetical protein